MFSITTTALSTSIPTPSISPSRVRTLNCDPSRYMAPQVTTSEKGMATATIRVVRRRRRKAKSTPTASRPPKMPALRSPESERRISSPELFQISSWMPSSCGSDSISSIRCISLSTVATVLADGSLKTSIEMANSRSR